MTTRPPTRRPAKLLKYIEGEEAAPLTSAGRPSAGGGQRPTAAVDAPARLPPLRRDRQDRAAGRRKRWSPSPPPRASSIPTCSRPSRTKTPPSSRRRRRRHLPGRRRRTAPDRQGAAQGRGGSAFANRVALGLGATVPRREAIPGPHRSALRPHAGTPRQGAREFLTEAGRRLGRFRCPPGNAPFERKMPPAKVWRAWWKASEGSTLLDEVPQADADRRRTRGKTLELIKDLTKGIGQGPRPAPRAGLVRSWGSRPCRCSASSTRRAPRRPRRPRIAASR